MDDNQKIADLTEAIRLNPNNAKAYSNRGVAYANKKDYDRAIADFTDAIRLNPNSALVYYSRGVVYANKRDYDRAIADLTEAVRLEPNNATAAAALAKVKAAAAVPDFAQYAGDFQIEGTTLLEYKGSGGNVTVPTGVISIGKRAFQECRSLSNITLPVGLTSIGEQAFDGCRSLSSITLPAGLTSIGKQAFDGCRSLSSITLPAGLTSIGKQAFDGCEKIGSAHFSNYVQKAAWPEGVKVITGDALAKEEVAAAEERRIAEDRAAAEEKRKKEEAAAKNSAETNVSNEERPAMMNEIQQQILMITEAQDRCDQTLSQVRDGFLEYNKIQDNMQKELEMHRSGVFKQLLDPVLSAISRIYSDYVVNLEKLGKEKIEDPHLNKNFDYLFDDLEQVLSENGVEEYNSNPGDPVSIRFCKIKDKVATNDKTLDRTVIKSHNKGFRLGQRVLMPEVVDVYIFSESAVTKEEK